MARHFDSNQDGVADSSEDHIGALENETIFVPDDEHVDPHAETQMQMGSDPENDLRDPWFHTPKGQRWLAAQGEVDA